MSETFLLVSGRIGFCVMVFQEWFQERKQTKVHAMPHADQQQKSAVIERHIFNDLLNGIEHACFVQTVKRAACVDQAIAGD
jgi:hypothetical protein